MAYFQPSSNIHPGFAYKAPQKPESSSSSAPPAAPQMDIPVEGIDDTFIRRTDTENTRFRLSPEPNMEPETAPVGPPPPPPPSDDDLDEVDKVFIINFNEHSARLNEAIKKKNSSEIQAVCPLIIEEVEKLESHKKEEHATAVKQNHGMSERLKYKTGRLSEYRQEMSGKASELKAEKEQLKELEEKGKGGTYEHEQGMLKARDLEYNLRLMMSKAKKKDTKLKMKQEILAKDIKQSLNTSDNMLSLAALKINLEQIFKEAKQMNRISPTFSVLANQINDLQTTLSSFKLGAMLNPPASLNVPGRESSHRETSADIASDLDLDSMIL